MTNIDEKADRELVELIATKLMGWIDVRPHDNGPLLGWFDKDAVKRLASDKWNPLTNAKHSKQVRDKLAERFNDSTLRCDSIIKDKPYWEFEVGNIWSGPSRDEDPITATGDTEFRAVAEVARKVVERG